MLLVAGGTQSILLVALLVSKTTHGSFGVPPKLSSPFASRQRHNYPQQLNSIKSSFNTINGSQQVIRRSIAFMRKIDDDDDETSNESNEESNATSVNNNNTPEDSGVTAADTAPPSSSSFVVLTMEEEIQQGLRKARLILEKSKAKLAARNPPSAVPFFAATTAITKITMSDNNNDNDDDDDNPSVVQSTNAVTGLITKIDGDKLAARSEREVWEYRSMDDVDSANLESSADPTAPAGPSAAAKLASRQLGERDVAASIYNLRQQLQLEDYQVIFDPKNRFIGEVN